MRLAFNIATRFLFANKGQTLLIVLGIAVGVSVQIFIGSLIQGLQASLIDKTVGNSSQITVYPENEQRKMDDYEELINQIKRHDKKMNVISVTADGSGFIRKEDDTNPILLRGFNLDDANKIYEFNDKLTEGKLPNANNEVIVGRELKEKLNLSLNQEVEILTPKNSITTVKITGFYDLNVKRINESWIISDLNTSQTIFKLGDSITSIEIQIEDVFEADTITSQLKTDVSDYNVKITNWKEQNQELLSGLEGQSISSIMIQVFVLISVVLGIASVLAISVMQKSKQLGILKAMGIKNKQASLIYLFQGLILGLIGAILGILIGIGLLVSFTTFVVLEDGSSVVPLTLNSGFIVLSGVIAVLSATIASLIPARRSSKLDPVEVIRNG
ncbi:ABC transporter permease [Haloplasma contractile]|uniref:Integral membrane protein n=1 Tax=Haloplasma contractile SSD-17B TaxID=1033810 RepID=F7Q1M6_9MOLU|nr:FtsX-like permease family protein [Haloplasma contractile]ERJ12956.1 Integral membrane protein [Haloplasma contractile SSD-17B]